MTRSTKSLAVAMCLVACDGGGEADVSWWQSLLWGTPAEERPIQPARRVLLAEVGSPERLRELVGEVQQRYRRPRTVRVPVQVSEAVGGWVALDLGTGAHPYPLHYTASRLHHDHGVRALAWSVGDDPRFTYVLGPDPRGGWRMIAGWREDGVTVSVSRENNQVFNAIDLQAPGNYEGMFAEAGVPEVLRQPASAWPGVREDHLDLPDFGNERNPDLRILTPDDAHLGVVDIEMRFRSGAR